MRVSISSLFFGFYSEFVAIIYGGKYVVFPLLRKFFWVSKMQTKLHEAREKKWVISRDCFLVSHLIGREVMGKKRTHCYPGFDTQGKIPQSNEANENAKLSHAIATLRGKTRVTELWLVLMPHLIGWEVGTSFPGQSQRGEKQNLYNHWLLFEPQPKGL